MDNLNIKIDETLPPAESVFIQPSVTETLATTEPQLTGRARSIANLHKFSKGKSGNPSGRTKGITPIKYLIERYGKMSAPEKLIDKIKEQFPGIRKLKLHEAVVLRTYLEAIRGQSWAVEFLAERGEGKVPTNFQMHATGLGDVIFQVMNDDQQKKITDANAGADEV